MSDSNNKPRIRPLDDRSDNALGRIRVKAAIGAKNLDSAMAEKPRDITDEKFFE